jgi:hypothetical protein
MAEVDPASRGLTGYPHESDAKSQAVTRVYLWGDKALAIVAID